MPFKPVARRTVTISLVALLALIVLAQSAALLLLHGRSESRIRAMVIREAEKATGCDVQVGGFHAALFNRVIASDISIRHEGRLLASAHEIIIQYNPFRWITGGFDPLAMVTRIELVKPTVNARLLDGKRLDLLEILGGRGEPAGEPALRAAIAVKDGIVTVEGLPEVNTGQVTALNGHVSFSRYPVLRVAANGRLQRPAELGFAIDGTVDVRKGRLEGRAQVEGARLDEWDRLGLLPKEYGRFSGRIDAALQGSWIGGRASLKGGRLDWKQGSYVHPATGVNVNGINARAVFEPDEIRIRSLSAAWQGSRVSVSGYAGGWQDPRIDLKVTGHKVDLQRVMAFIPQVAQVRVSGRADVSARIRGRAANPRVSAAVQVADGSVNGQSLDRLDIKAEYEDARLDIGLRSEVLSGRADGWAVWYPFTSDRRLTAEVRVHTIDMKRAIALTPWQSVPVSGKLSGRFVVRSSAADTLRVFGTAEASAGEIAGQPFDTAESAFHFKDRRLTLESLLARRGTGILTARGSIGQDGELSLSGAARQFELREVLRAAGIPGSGTAGMRFDLGGSVEKPTGRADLSITGTAVQGIHLGTLEAEALLDGRQLEISRIQLSHPEHKVSGNGTMNLARGTMEGRLDAAGIPLGLVLKAAGVKGFSPIGGVIDADIEVSGNTSGPQVQGALRMGRLQIGPEIIDGAEAEVSWDGRVLQIRSMDVRKGSATAILSGTMDSQGALAGAVRLEALSLDGIEALKGIVRNPTGSLSLTGGLSGTVAAPEFEGVLAGTDIGLSGFELGAVSGNIAWSKNRLNLGGFRLKQDSKSYVLHGWVDPAHNTADVRLDCDNGRVAELVGLIGLKLPQPMDGVITGLVEVRGDLRNPVGRLAAEIKEANVAGTPFNGSVDAGFDVQLAPQTRVRELTLTRLRLWHKDGYLLASGRYNGSEGTDVAITARRFDISPIMALAGGTDVLSGLSDADLKLVGYPSKPLLSGDLELTGGQVAGIDFDRFRAVASVDGEGVTLRQVRFERKGDVALADGFVPFNDAVRHALGLPRPAFQANRALDLDIASGSFALDWLPALISPSLKVTRGRLSVQAHVGGALSRPDMSGTFAIAQGAMDVPGLVQPFSTIEGRGHFEGDRIVFDDFRAGYGNGRLTAGGSLSMVFFGMKRYDLWVKADKLSYAGQPFTGTIRGAVSYRGPSDAPVLGGEVWVSDARISAPLGGGGTGGPLPAIGLDLTVHAGSDVRLKQGLTVVDLDVPVEGTIHAGGNLASPKLKGQMTANRGTIVAYRNVFQVTEAHAEFSENRGVLPFIRVMARRPVKEAVVFLRVEGEAGSDLSLAFDSSPYLSQQEILTALDIPEMLRDNGMNAQNLLDEGIYVMGKAVFDTVGRNVAQWLNVDDFSLIPRGDSWFSSGLELRVGKFITPQFYLGYSSVFDETPVQGLSADYYASPWSVFNFSFSTAGDFDVGYSWRIRF